MKNTNRRNFLRNAAIAGTVICFASVTKERLSSSAIVEVELVGITYPNFYEELDPNLETGVLGAIFTRSSGRLQAG